MKTRFLPTFCALALLLLLAGCISTPESVYFGGRSVPTVSVVKAGCNFPYELEQDCSGFSGGTRTIDYKGTRLRIAGSADGTIAFFMHESKWTVKTAVLKSALEGLERDFAELGLPVTEATAVAGNGELAGMYMVFAGDAYSILKDYTVED